MFFQLQHLDTVGDLRLPDPVDRRLFLPHEHRSLVQATSRSYHTSTDQSQEEETKGKNCAFKSAVIVFPPAPEKAPAKEPAFDLLMHLLQQDLHSDCKLILHA